MISRKEKSKKVNYQILSNQNCPDCGRPIKANVANRTTRKCYCYVCFKLRKGKVKVDKHKIVNGEKVFIKTINFEVLQKENKRKYICNER